MYNNQPRKILLKDKWIRVVLTVLAVVIGGGICPAARQPSNLWRATYPDIIANSETTYLDR